MGQSFGYSILNTPLSEKSVEPKSAAEAMGIGASAPVNHPLGDGIFTQVNTPGSESSPDLWQRVAEKLTNQTDHSPRPSVNAAAASNAPSEPPHDDLLWKIFSTVNNHYQSEDHTPEAPPSEQNTPPNGLSNGSLEEPGKTFYSEGRQSIQLTGGSDTVVYSYSSRGRDFVRGFDPENDRVVYDPGEEGRALTFSETGPAPFSAWARESGRDTYLYMETDGNRVSNLTIRLEKTKGFTEDNFSSGSSSHGGDTPASHAHGVNLAGMPQSVDSPDRPGNKAPEIVAASTPSIPAVPLSNAPSESHDDLLWKVLNLVGDHYQPEDSAPEMAPASAPGSGQSAIMERSTTPQNATSDQGLHASSGAPGDPQLLVINVEKIAAAFNPAEGSLQQPFDPEYNRPFLVVDIMGMVAALDYSQSVTETGAAPPDASFSWDELNEFIGITIPGHGAVQKDLPEGSASVVGVSDSPDIFASYYEAHATDEASPAITGKFPILPFPVESSIAGSVVHKPIDDSISQQAQAASLPHGEFHKAAPVFFPGHPLYAKDDVSQPFKYKADGYLSADDMDLVGTPSRASFLDLIDLQ